MTIGFLPACNAVMIDPAPPCRITTAASATLCWNSSIFRNGTATQFRSWNGEWPCWTMTGPGSMATLSLTACRRRMNGFLRLPTETNVLITAAAEIPCGKCGASECHW